MAEKAVSFIADRMENPSRPPEEHTAPFELKVRESTR
jgi:DNA-binding LacI/PurR family transcriptional regulator